MSKFLYRFFAPALTVLILFTALGALFAVNPGRIFAEEIKDFKTRITISRDGVLDVTETIVYDFGNLQKHGIFRKIPLHSKDGPDIYIDLADSSGQISFDNDYINIKIGDPNKFVTGQQIYNIAYKVYGAMRFFDDHDEVYWNATGNEWPVSIKNANAELILSSPQIMDEIKVGQATGTSTSTLGYNCFAGYYSDANKSCYAFYITDTNDPSKKIGISYQSTNLLSGQGLTVVMSIPKGYIDYQAYQDAQKGVGGGMAGSIRSIFDYIWFIFLFIIFFVIRFLPVSILSLVLSRVPSRRKTKPVIPKELRDKAITTQYQPPADLSPVEVGTILDRRTDPSDISSIIINLAVKGFLKIKYLGNTSKFLPSWLASDDFEFIKLKEYQEKPTDISGDYYLKEPEQIMFDYIFSEGDKVKLSTLSRRLDSYSYIERIGTAVTKVLTVAGYFNSSNGSWFIKMFSVNHLSETGLVVLEKILGFKQFLEDVESDKFKLLNSPSLKPEMFEKFLPYAMVLGVEKEWAKKFESIYRVPPIWYEGPMNSAFNSLYLVNTISSFDRNLSRAFAVQSGQGYSSGFSGGGFSGGGSGGGGGGSW